MKKDSPVIAFLALVYANASGSDNKNSWRILNHALWTTLRLCIVCGYKFKEDDFLTISERFSFHHWGGMTSAGLGEMLYALAVEGPHQGETGLPNVSACLAFEAWKGREGWHWRGRRVALGSEFHWWEKWPRKLTKTDPAQWVPNWHGATRFWVTNLDNETLSLCWYKNPGNRQVGKPARRLVLTRQDLRDQQRLINGYYTNWEMARKKPGEVEP